MPNIPFENSNEMIDFYTKYYGKIRENPSILKWFLSKQEWRNFENDVFYILMPTFPEEMNYFILYLKDKFNKILSLEIDKSVADEIKKYFD